MLVRTDKTEGYIRAASVSPVWISWTTDSEDRGSGNNGSSGAGIGGADGGDITLGNRMNEAALPVLLSSRREEPETGSAVRPSDGMILADGTELYLGIVYPGDELMILSADDKTAEIYSSRGTGILPRWAVLIGNEEPYSAWTGYSLYGAKMYGDYRMTGEYEEKALNTEMTVILETDNGFFIKLSDGRFGYMERSAVSRTKTVVYYNDSGSGSGDIAVEEWTVPVL